MLLSKAKECTSVSSPLARAGFPIHRYLQTGIRFEVCDKHVWKT